MTTVLDAPVLPAALLPPADKPDPLGLLVGELKRQLETKRDLMADTRLTSLACQHNGEQFDEPGGNPRWRGLERPEFLLDLNGVTEAFQITRHAHSQIATHLGIGWRLYDRLLNGEAAEHKVADRHRYPQRDLLVDLVNGLLGREHSTRMLRTMDGRLRAFLSNGFRPRDNWDLLEQAILPELVNFPGCAVRDAHLTETNLYMRITLPHALPVGPPAVGDLLHAGLIVRNSEVGAGSLLIAPFTTVLSCINGQTHTEYGSRQRHVAGRITNDGAAAWELYSDKTLRLDDEAFFSRCRDLVRAALSEEVFALIVRDMNALVDIRVDAPPTPAVEVLRKHVEATEGEGQSIMRHLIEGGNLSAWGYLQAVTATARDLDNQDRRAELEHRAGLMVAAPNTWVPRLNAAGS